MSVFDREPHTIQVIKPTPDRDSATGATKLDYDTPISDRQVKGFLSTRGGTMTTGDEGQLIPFDAVFFTKDTVIGVNDQAVVALGWLDGNFIVVGTEPKAGLDGDFDHNEVVLAKDNRR